MSVTGYSVTVLTDDERARLERCYQDLMVLSRCDVPAVRAAARAAVAHIAQALNGEGIAYELFTRTFDD